MLRIDVMPCVGFSKTLNLGNTISDVGLPPGRLGMNPVKGHHGVRIQVNTIDKGMKSKMCIRDRLCKYIALILSNRTVKNLALN